MAVILISNKCSKLTLQLFRSDLLDLAETTEEASRDPLTSPEYYDDHLQKLSELDKKGSEVNRKIGELREYANSITQLLPGVHNDVTEQLNGNSKNAEELIRRIGEI